MTTAKVWDENTSSWVPVYGGVSQADFDALNGRLNAAEVKVASGKRDVVRVGPVTGNGGNIQTTFTTLPGFAMSYTTRNEPMQGIIWVYGRIQTNTAAWNWSYFDLSITPAPPSRLASTGNNQISLMACHSGGNAYHWCRGFDYVQLNANTTYTFQIGAHSSAANVFQWTAGAENAMQGEFWGR